MRRRFSADSCGKTCTRCSRSGVYPRGNTFNRRGEPRGSADSRSECPRARANSGGVGYVGGGVQHGVEHIVRFPHIGNAACESCNKPVLTLRPAFLGQVFVILLGKVNLIRQGRINRIYRVVLFTDKLLRVEGKARFANSLVPYRG